MDYEIMEVTNLLDIHTRGMTFKQTVGGRMGNHDHHIHDFEDDKTVLKIWIGTIANIKAEEWSGREA